MPVAVCRVVHLVVVYGFQGASTDPEKLRLTEKLLDAVFCELAVVASGQPCLIVGDLNIEPEKIPCLLKGFTAGHWFDLQSSWAAASGGALLLPAPGLLVLVVGPAEGGERGVCSCLSHSLLLRQSGVRFFRIAGFFPITLSWPLSLWVVGRLGFVCLLGFLTGLLLGLLVLIGLGVVSLPRFVVFGRCTMSLC